MIFCRVVTEIEWECLYNMPETMLAHTCEFPLCLHVFPFSFPSFFFLGGGGLFVN